MVVIDMQVAGMPPLGRRVTPAFKFDVERDVAGDSAFNRALPWCELRAALDTNLHAATRNLQSKLSIGVEKRLSGTHFPHRTNWSELIARRTKHLHPGPNSLARNGVGDCSGHGVRPGIGMYRAIESVHR